MLLNPPDKKKEVTGLIKCFVFSTYLNNNKKKEALRFLI